MDVPYAVCSPTRCLRTPALLSSPGGRAPPPPSSPLPRISSTGMLIPNISQCKEPVSPAASCSRLAVGFESCCQPAPPLSTRKERHCSMLFLERLVANPADRSPLVLRSVRSLALVQVAGSPARSCSASSRGCFIAFYSQLSRGIVRPALRTTPSPRYRIAPSQPASRPHRSDTTRSSSQQR